MLFVFTSDGSARSKAIAESFKGATDWAIRLTYDLGAEVDAGAFIADNTRDMTVSGVFAVGDLALRAAAREYPSLPIIYADADADAAGVARPGVTGVTTRVDPALTLARITQIVPGIRTIGAVMGSQVDDRAYGTRMQAAATAAGLTASTAYVSSAADARSHARELLAANDVTWLVPAPGVWSGATLAGLFQEARLLKKPIIGFSRSHVEGGQGAQLALSANPAGIGTAAAAGIAELLGRGAETAAPAIAPLVFGNLEALRLVGIAVTKARASAIDEMLR